MLSTYVDGMRLSTIVDGSYGGNGCRALCRPAGCRWIKPRSPMPDPRAATFRLLRGARPDAHLCSAASAVLVHPGLREAVREAAVCERAGLLGGPAVTGEAGSARPG